MPILAMWYQIRTAVADILIPALAGFKTLWLIFFAPVTFFTTYFHRRQPLDQLRSPLGPLWRALSPERQRPLDPAQFLLFGIFTAMLAGFAFDNSNRLSGLLQELEITHSVQQLLSQQSATAAQTVNAIEQFQQNPILLAARSLMDQEIIAAIVELFVNLVIIVIFAYIFRLLAWGISATHSYAFWLYMAGMQFFTTAVSHLFFSFVSLSMFNLPANIPQLLFWLMESGLWLYWQFLFPALLLPRVFPGLTAKRVIMAALVGRLILMGFNWLFVSGLFIFAILTAWING